jgi:hypothetical protein
MIKLNLNLISQTLNVFDEDENFPFNFMLLELLKILHSLLFQFRGWNEVLEGDVKQNLYQKRDEKKSSFFCCT